MACQALRAALLAFLVAITVPGAPSEASGSETEPDFIVTIRSNGVQENTQQVFSLRPSATLRVVDESAKAFFLPQSATADQDSAPGYNFAYVFENGRCNFERTVAYKEAFPGHSQPLWVRSAYHENAGGNVPEDGIPIYTFTNPPAEHLNGGVSFCVRFTTDSAATSTTTKSPTGAVESTTRPSESTESSSSSPTVSSGSTSQSSGGEGTLPGSGAEGGTSGDSSENTDDSAHPQVPQPPGSVPPSQPPNTNEEEEDKDAGSGEAHEDGPGVEGPNKGDAGNGSADSGPSGVVPDQTETQAQLEPSGTGNDLPVAGSSSALPQQSQDAQHITNNREPALSDSTDLAGSEAPDHSAETPASTMSQGAVTGSAGNDGVAEGNARLRRLSDTETSSIKYLTIIVHSAAVGSSAGTLTLSAALLSITATVCLAFDYGI
ncbi:Toxoplasma gondii family A protein [Toxoplasma gondii GAB2-2007-GAL-DOM2]|uniref:Toxoplasma gondii family A protein n=5 Tax=Toxoplasma gondii TaxID=5811 RepID=S7W0R6_TOXGG|nr:Toxoplasma gondii family A protein [Toxoplasma gondii GT1]KAF4643260.1 Toxoplasma gondii family A protein [Toxoplasma gondii]KFG32973.1 Toxoplasma gondii family A protein [Toxoplasma gondii GAB2-2007-GAL-DOM2]RQX69083.1 Toxoplasma gondii family A protein [Toxoplasma gondii CAST]